jgi:regulator of cell morphogenesis and NO signaling
MDYMDKNLTIGEVVAQLPASSKIFSKYGIDFCCGGNRKLYVAINDLGLNHNEINKELEAADEERESSYKDMNFMEMEPHALSDYINDTHHSYLRRVLPEITDILATIVRVHGINHPELFEVYKLYGSLRTDLEQHLLKEETMLFPAFEAEKEKQDEIRKLTGEIISEHEAAGEILVKLRSITRDYTLPEDACATFGRAYSLLEELEKDLHQHIHLENNILLKEYDERVRH